MSAPFPCDAAPDSHAQTYQIMQDGFDKFAYIGAFTAAPFEFSGIERVRRLA